MESCMIKQLYCDPELLYDKDYTDKVALVKFAKSIGYSGTDGNTFTKTENLLPDLPEELTVIDMKMLKDKFTE